MCTYFICNFFISKSVNTQPMHVIYVTDIMEKPFMSQNHTWNPCGMHETIHILGSCKTRQTHANMRAKVLEFWSICEPRVADSYYYQMEAFKPLVFLLQTLDPWLQSVKMGSFPWASSSKLLGPRVSPPTSCSNKRILSAAQLVIPRGEREPEEGKRLGLGSSLPSKKTTHTTFLSISLP